MRLHVLLVTVLVFSVSANASPLPEYPFVFATGRARIQVEPNTAVLIFVFSARHALEAEALNAVQVGSQTVLATLSNADVKIEDIDASLINKLEHNHWDEETERSVSDGYEVQRKFVVVFRDLTRYPEIGKALLALPGTSDFQPNFNRTDRDKIEGEVFQLAAKDAKAQAERMAASFEQTIGAVRAISQIPLGEVSNQFGIGDSQRQLYGYLSSGPLDIKPDSLLVPARISIAAEVNVVFELK